ncbi:head maturation protease, ClpP-related [Paracoccus simplex]|uniref:ATP-dependent Clp protease proteolytic subunit n=1 Tax=Paracoccus simplex TaxID=2086346 RepID=A0ABV7RU37_9RHOB
MAKNHMPVAHFGVRPENVRAECAPKPAFEKWQPELRGARSEAANTEEGPFVIDMMDVIGETWDGYGVTARRVGALLRSAAGRPIIANINSPGGDVFEGLAIYNMLRTYEGDVTVRILGLAASAASVIAMAGDRVEIARAGFLMIHNTWVFAVGDRHDLTTVAGQLGAFDEVLADLYAVRTGIEAAEIGQRMDREFWVSGKSAVDQGFADDLLDADQITISNSLAVDGPKIQYLRQTEGALALYGMSRSERRSCLKNLTAKPRAGDDDMPGAVETMANLTGWAKSLSAKMEN